MRQIKDRGGPSLGYQSEVEHGKKVEVRSDVLSDWISTLGVNEPFVRGQIPRYLDDPDACRGLAADVGRLIASGRAANIEWVNLMPLDRARQVLWLISTKSRKLPRLVLAWVLGLEAASLDAVVQGRMPLVRDLMKAIADLTTLPEEFFKYGTLGEPDAAAEEADQYSALAALEPEQTDAEEQAALDIVRLARSKGLTLADLRALVLRA
jgi:hypothetical protein